MSLNSELNSLWDDLKSSDESHVKTAAPSEPKEIGGNVQTDSLQMAADVLQKIQALGQPPISADSEPVQGDPQVTDQPQLPAGAAPNGVPGQSVMMEVPAGMSVKIASVDHARNLFRSMGLINE